MLDIYKASAGSGKTFTLALEYIRMLLMDFPNEHKSPHGMPHTHILAVTFTKKATAEMKERILKELYQLASGGDSAYLSLLEDVNHGLDETAIRRRSALLLNAILQDYSSFAVSTIDGFFQQVVRSFARELGLPATYELTLDGDEVVEMAIDSLLHRVRTTPPDEQQAWLRDFALQNIEDNHRWNPKEDIVQFSKQLLRETIGHELPLLKAFFADKKGLAAYRKMLQEIINQYEAEFGVPTEYAKKKKEVSEQMVRYLSAGVLLKNLYPLGLLQDVAQEIEKTNQEKNRLPIHEINLLLSWLIDHSDTPFVYEKLGQWLHHYMIDEFQDTSTLQWANFRPLISEAEAQNRQNLIVGDVKQSIYRWRNSNWHLLENAASQFRQTREPRMKHNFRSSPTLVSLNNTLFSSYRDWVAHRLDESWPDDPTFAETIRTIYADERLHQQPVKTFEGYAEWRFFEGTADEITEQGLAAIPGILLDWQHRGGKMNQVAVIVRKRSEARCVAEYLTREGFRVQSADGLLIDNHPAVQILIGLMTAIYHPEQTEEHTIQGVQLTRLLGHPLSDEERQLLASLRSQPVYTLSQQLIEQYHLDTLSSAPAYLTTFLDCVFHFTQTRTCDAESFLDYWQRHKDHLSIPSAISEDTLQVMTIHSSKGLEFDVVILPFLTWPLAKPKTNDIIWCRPKEEPFSRLPLVPIHPVALLDNTIFRQDYRQEMLDQYIDNLNLTYVAFTRAKRELYAFGEQAKTLKSGKPKVESIGHLLSVLYASQLTDGCLTVGTRCTIPAPITETPAAVSEALYTYSPIALRTKQQTSHITDLGNRMHSWLGQIRIFDDAERALQQMLRDGTVREEQTDEMRQLMNTFREMVRDTDWFDGRNTVLLETDILTPSGQTYRPDRIVVKDRHAVVIDYKFGEEHKRAYHEQVRGYMTLLERMGYQTEGWLVYVSQQKLEAV